MWGPLGCGSFFGFLNRQNNAAIIFFFCARRKKRIESRKFYVIVTKKQLKKGVKINLFGRDAQNARDIRLSSLFTRQNQKVGDGWGRSGRIARFSL